MPPRFIYIHVTASIMLEKDRDIGRSTCVDLVPLLVPLDLERAECTAVRILDQLEKWSAEAHRIYEREARGSAPARAPRAAPVPTGLSSPPRFPRAPHKLRLRAPTSPEGSAATPAPHVEAEGSAAPTSPGKLRLRLPKPR